MSHNNTVIYNVPLQSDSSNLLKKSSSKLLTSSMSSSILSSSLKLAKQLLEENSNDSVDAGKKGDSSSSTLGDKDAVASTTCDVVTDNKMVAETQQNEKTGGTEKCLPVVHHVDRFRPITFKLLMQEQVTVVSMGTLHTAFVTGKYSPSYLHT